ncbi:cutinase family protein [Nocardia arthritidis]|uniref:Cutinase family protein n=1 Tax=Nocardia arthritidis TaxID=228602 RepID=A0A6G9Y9T5_9NOCA|nr:cutinase family protein [Nocardia arthritidis]QIS09837.1 cutinase family protein [Nocardia arthritidis]
MKRPIATPAIWIAALAATAMLAGTTPAVAAPAPADPSGSGCPSVAGIFVPGTWETNPQADPARPIGLLAPIGTGLAERFGERFLARFPGYSASAWDRGMSYGASEATGITAASAEITDLAQRCGAAKFVLSGYSQGADIIGDLAASIGCGKGPIPPERVIAVGLIADPKQGTAGGKVVGPALDGQGIAGPRPGGFCQLSAVTAQLCDPRDKYCNTNAATNPILAGLGRILSGKNDQPSAPGPDGALAVGDNPAGATDQAGALGVDAGQLQALTQSLISDFGRGDLPKLAADLNTVVSQALSGRIDPGAVTAVQDTLRSLTDLLGWTGGNPSATERLAHAPAGSPEHQASQVLTAAKNSDLGTALDSLATIATQATQASGGPAPDVAGAANALVSSTAPLTAMSADTLSQATTVLSILKPSMVFEQVVNVATNTLGFATNVPKILDTLRQIATIVADGGIDLPAKVRGLHEQFGTLNNLCNPLVKMAAGVDLHAVSKLLAVIPDPQGVAQIASVIVGILANLDVVKLALQVGGLQEQLWGIAEAITGGGDLVDIGARLVGLIPTLLGFATTAVNTLTGAAKTPTAALDTPQSGAPTASMSGASNLAGLAESLVNSASRGAADLGQLIADGVSAASFFASGAHQGYDRFVVDESGRTAVTWLTDWFAGRIRQVGAV